ncbi:carboxypeptidase regulatory-like domain-containing protein [Mariniradius sediminis]|uniref:Carboxypeptidase regulatory-like domain-containing protein n=1 Tax=Mariniradius sediminis TaxID=2909237 RepID=A0ABS9BXY9_9BACT|nr:carboxypeptidase regulatory-like domain-containing protein [Mariniradius sediminis]MCF1752061.1 carboxypeptidase regulatory-like domain-containing protein [Mariniradius sediminis]
MKHQSLSPALKLFRFLTAALFCLAFVVVSSCDHSDETNLVDDLDILAQSLATQHGRIGVKDAANDGIDEFYFLGPTVGKDPKYHGRFNPNLNPKVEISDDLSFNQIHAAFGEKAGGSNKVHMSPAEETYYVNWDPGETQAVVGKIYRIRVVVANKVLGYADVGIVTNPEHTLRNGLIPVAQNQQFRIAFRIEDKICPARILIEPGEASLVPGEEIQLRGTIFNFFDEELTDVKRDWSVEDESVATIDQNGLLKALKAGTTKVTLRSFDVSVSIDVTVVESNGQVIGRVVDALSGNPIEGARVAFGSQFEVFSESDGHFAIDVPQGNYEVTVQKTGYIASSVPDFAVEGNATNNLGLIALSPILQSGELRIVLTWNPTIDLDSHLTGPIPNSPFRFHVYWITQFTEFASLDIDDLFGPGPETITINQTFEGVYRYSVHNFANTANGLANSNAKVRVFRGDEQIAIFDAPQQSGTLWKVFEFDGITKEITVFNEMSNEFNSSAVTRVNPDAWEKESNDILKAPRTKK